MPACKTFLLRGPWAALVGGYSITYLFQYITLTLLSGCSYETDGPDSRPAPQPGIEKKHTQQQGLDSLNSSTPAQSFWKKLQFGVSAASSFRWSGTKRQVKNVPHFSANDPSYVPSRATFLRQTATKIVACYLIIDLLGLANEEGMNVANFDSSKIPLLTRLNEISLAELVTRCSATVGAGVGIYCSQDCLQSMLAFVTVALGSSKVEDWRPRFGAVGDAYSMRRFWSFFWHQNNRRIISEPTRFITTHILKLPKENLLTQHVSLVMGFLLSGILHMIIDVASGIPWGESGAIRFFGIQAFGILLEESIQALYSSDPTLQRLFKPRMSWCRTFQCASVFVFMIWTVPGWTYPMMWRTESGMQDSVLPFSILAIFV